jgi:hypothetical protein
MKVKGYVVKVGLSTLGQDGEKLTVTFWYFSTLSVDCAEEQTELTMHYFAFNIFLRSALCVMGGFVYYRVFSTR